MDYTEDKTDENEEYPRSDAASANKKLCPTLVEIVKHVFELHGGRGIVHLYQITKSGATNQNALTTFLPYNMYFHCSHLLLSY